MDRQIEISEKNKERKMLRECSKERKRKIEKERRKDI